MSSAAVAVRGVRVDMMSDLVNLMTRLLAKIAVLTCLAATLSACGHVKGPSAAHPALLRDEPSVSRDVPVPSSGVLAASQSAPWDDGAEAWDVGEAYGPITGFTEE